MPTLILSPRQTEDAQRLWRAASELGWNVERLASWRVPPDLRDAPEPVLYAEALVAPTLAEALGITLAEPPDDWLPRLPPEYRGRDVRLTTAAEARANPDPMFVKPPNDKSFPAGVCRGADIPAFVDGAAPVLIQEVVEWELEFRCFVLDREVKTLSIYLRGGELQKDAGYASSDAEDAAAQAFAARVLSDNRVSLPAAAVLDVGVVRGRGWAVVELNSAWGAGLYGCDAVAALGVIRRAAGRPARGDS